MIRHLYTLQNDHLSHTKPHTFFSCAENFKIYFRSKFQFFNVIIDYSHHVVHYISMTYLFSFIIERASLQLWVMLRNAFEAWGFHLGTPYVSIYWFCPHLSNSKNMLTLYVKVLFLLNFWLKAIKVQFHKHQGHFATENEFTTWISLNT